MDGHDLVSLKEYVDVLFTERQRLLDMQFQEGQRAIDKAERTMNSRLEGMNEFQDQLRDQASRLISRDEVNSSLKSMDESIRGLQKIADTAAGKASQTSMLFAAAISVAGLILGLINLFMK